MHEAWAVLPWTGRGSSGRDRAYVARQLRAFGVDDDDVVELVTSTWRLARQHAHDLIHRLRFTPHNGSERIATHPLASGEAASIVVVPTEDEVIIGVRERLPWPQRYILRETAIRAAKHGLEANVDAIPNTTFYQRLLALLAGQGVTFAGEHVYVLEANVCKSGFVGFTAAAPYGGDPRTGFWVTHHRWYTHGERITLERNAAEARAYMRYLEATYTTGPGGLYGSVHKYEVAVFFSLVYGVEIDDLTYSSKRRALKGGAAPTRAELEERRVLRAFASL